MVIRSENRVNPRPVSRWRELLWRIDFLQLLTMSALLVVGTCFIYSTGQQMGGQAASNFWTKQLHWIALGVGVWLLMSIMHYRWLGFWGWMVYAASIVLLILVLIIGLKVYGARRWLLLGPFRMQPSELAKFGVLLALSFLLSLKGFKINRLGYLAIVGALVGVPFLLILKEPDLGSALVLIPLTGALLFVARIKWRFIIIAAIIAAVALPAGWFFVLKGYQKERIRVFLNPEHSLSGKGWQQNQALLAVGSGGFSGKGYMQGTQHSLGFLPQTHTDFIFSVIAEETGFVGSISVLAVFALLLLTALRTAVLARDEFGRYLAIGIAAIFFTHTFVNIGMNLRLTPVTGLPLPLVSYGGSFIVVTMMYLGILQSIFAHRRHLTFDPDPSSQ